MLNPRWHKVIRDLWSGKTITIVVVMAIAVGGFACARGFITNKVLIGEMGTKYHAYSAYTNTISVGGDER